MSSSHFKGFLHVKNVIYSRLQKRVIMPTTDFLVKLTQTAAKSL